jgi:hypothetical protein
MDGSVQWSELRPEHIELDDHGVIGMVERDELVALIRKRSPALGEVGQKSLRRRHRHQR